MLRIFNNPSPDLYRGLEYQRGHFYSCILESINLSTLEMDKLPIFVKISGTGEWFLIGISEQTQDIIQEKIIFNDGLILDHLDPQIGEIGSGWCDYTMDDLVARRIINANLKIKIENIAECNFQIDVANEKYYEVIENLKYLLANHENSVNFSVRDCEEKTPLIIAAKVSGACDLVISFMLNEMVENYPNLIQELNIDAQDDQGRTALHYLCAYGLLDHVKKLVAFGANINIADEYGMTPLDFAYANQEQLQFMLGSIAINGDRASNFYTELGGHYFDLGYAERAAKANAVGVRESNISIVDVILANRKKLNIIQELTQLGAKDGTGPKMLRGSDATYVEDTKFLTDRDPTFCLFYERCVAATKLKNAAAKQIQTAYKKHKAHRPSF